MAARQLGRFEILEHIATGGMADVYLARVPGLAGFERLCVVKVLLPGLAQQGEYRDMLLDEARLCATLQHANIVQVFDVGECSGEYFIAMEHLHGRDLAQLLVRLVERGGWIPREHALHILSATLAGLHYAHEQKGPDGSPLNIIHRDVSPQNLFLTFDGHVKLLDFGLAKAANRLNQTQVGVIKGKLSYMSPEQACGKPVDRRTDIFAAGIVLWELTCGRRLFGSPDAYERLRSVADTDVPRPSTVRPGYEPELEAIVMKALAREPEARYQTAAAMQADIEAFAQRNGLSLAPSGLAKLVSGAFPDEAAARPGSRPVQDTPAPMADKASAGGAEGQGADRAGSGGAAPGDAKPAAVESPAVADRAGAPGRPRIPTQPFVAAGGGDEQAAVGQLVQDGSEAATSDSPTGEPELAPPPLAFASEDITAVRRRPHEPVWAGANEGEDLEVGPEDERDGSGNHRSLLGGSQWLRGAQWQRSSQWLSAQWIRRSPGTRAAWAAAAALLFLIGALLLRLGMSIGDSQPPARPEAVARPPKSERVEPAKSTPSRKVSEPSRPARKRSRK